VRLGPAGNRTAIEEAGGTSRTYTYDALYRLTGETVADTTGARVYAKSFTYDPVGNRLAQTHQQVYRNYPQYLRAIQRYFI
jgi:YD repeat-containing protein